MGNPPIWLALVSVVVLVLVTIDVLHSGPLTHLDHVVSRQMVRWNLRHTNAKPVIYAFTLLGQRGTVVGVSGPVAFLLCWRERSIRPAALYVLALILIALVVYGMKFGTERTAPPLDSLHVSSGASFPSGHLVNASVLWWLIAAMAAMLGVANWMKTTLIVIAWTAPVAVVCSMTLLDYHWLSDFGGALCVGIVLRYSLGLLVPRVLATRAASII